MRRKWLLVLLIPFLTSCSWLSHFAIANKSPSAIFIEYQLVDENTKKPFCPNDENIIKPRLVDIEKLEKLKRYESIELPETKFFCDDSSGTVKIELEANKAVVILDYLNYTGFSSEKHFVDQIHTPIKALSVQGKYGKVTYEGSQVFRDFKSVKTVLNVLSYE